MFYEKSALREKDGITRCPNCSIVLTKDFWYPVKYDIRTFIRWGILAGSLGTPTYLGLSTLWHNTPLVLAISTAIGLVAGFLLNMVNIQLMYRAKGMQAKGMCCSNCRKGYLVLENVE